MASGIKGACNRPKTAKNLRRASSKKFRTNDEEARIKYNQKMAARAARKMKKRK